MVHILDNKHCKFKLEIFQIWQAILENILQYVSVKWSHWARIYCVINDFFHFRKLIIKFLKLVVISNKFYIYIRKYIILWVQFRGNISMHSWEIDCRRYFLSKFCVLDKKYQFFCKGQYSLIKANKMTLRKKTEQLKFCVAGGTFSNKIRSISKEAEINFKTIEKIFLKINKRLISLNLHFVWVL